MRIFEFKMRDPGEVSVDRKRLVCYLFPRSMKYRMNITTPIWPTLSVAKATRHDRPGVGCEVGCELIREVGSMFSLGLSRSHRGQRFEVSLGKLEVGR